MCIYREIWCNIILKNVGFIQHILPIFFEMINGLVTLGYVILCYIPIPQPSTGDEMERGRLGNWWNQRDSGANPRQVAFCVVPIRAFFVVTSGEVLKVFFSGSSARNLEIFDQVTASGWQLGMAQFPMAPRLGLPHLAVEPTGHIHDSTVVGNTTLKKQPFFEVPPILILWNCLKIPCVCDEAMDFPRIPRPGCHGVWSFWVSCCRHREVHDVLGAGMCAAPDWKPAFCNMKHPRICWKKWWEFRRSQDHSQRNIPISSRPKSCGCRGIFEDLGHQGVDLCDTQTLGVDVGLVVWSTQNGDVELMYIGLVTFHIVIIIIVNEYT